MIAVQKRSRMRHLVNSERQTTLCGRTLYRRNWRVQPDDSGCDCRQCARVLAAELQVAPLITPRSSESGEGTTVAAMAVAVAICLVVIIAQFIANVFNYVDPGAAF